MTFKDHNQGRWYIKKDDQVFGPYPNQLISRYLILGRMTLASEISQDQKNWVTVEHYKSLVPEVVLNAHTPEGSKALMLARRREDERSARSEDDSGESERRMDEDQVVKMHRQLRDDILNQYRNQPHINRRNIILLLAVAISLIAAFFSYRPTSIETGSDCDAPPASGMNWSMCNKQGKNLAGLDLRLSLFTSAVLNDADFSRSQLSGSDFSYANLSRAEMQQSQLQNAALIGANLRQANLLDANLEAANLSYAELEGARLEGARLDNARFDNAIWIDGQHCLPGSIGGCLLPRQ
ncbi:MAG: pentapeptide repeat-containing protein [Gammaproteobacteria bacterium]